MNTQTDRLSENNIDGGILQKYADIIKMGGVVAFPTETVYGLGANALDDNAVRKIFEIKGRPANNPLIAHISDISMLDSVAREIPAWLYPLFSQFWPGALTVVLEKREQIPLSVTAGGDTVAVRCPKSRIANELIRMSGVPIVAPSANLSGKPSPTRFEHVMADLNGRVDGIIDGGECEFGLESTVVAVSGKGRLKILRPGVITDKMLQSAGFETTIDENVLKPVKSGARVSSPGMLYRHYAPCAEMEIVRGTDKAVLEYITKRLSRDIGVLCFNGESPLFSPAVTVEYGDRNEPLSLSKNLFSALREFDKTGVKKIYARVIEPQGVGLGIYNRMIRAANFNVTVLEEDL